MMRLLPLAVAAALAVPAAAHAGCAPYVSVFAGMATTDTTITVGGVKLVDQGSDATMAGARAGCGHRWPNGLYLGAEAEIFAASGRSRVVIPAANSSTGQTEVWNRAFNGGAGVFARIGIAPGPVTDRAPPSLFYLRVGAQALDTSQGTEIVGAVGAGVEVRLTRHVAARIDITYAAGPVETYQGTLGVSWRF